MHRHILCDYVTFNKMQNIQKSSIFTRKLNLRNISWATKFCNEITNKKSGYIHTNTLCHRTRNDKVVERLDKYTRKIMGPR